MKPLTKVWAVATTDMYQLTAADLAQYLSWSLSNSNTEIFPHALNGECFDVAFDSAYPGTAEFDLNVNTLYAANQRGFQRFRITVAAVED